MPKGQGLTEEVHGTTCLPFGVLVSSTAASESVCSRSCLCRGDLRRVKCGGLYFCRVPCRGRAGSGVDMTVRGGEGPM